jgi:polyisoprenoid-binding protein YceI
MMPNSGLSNASWPKPQPTRHFPLAIQRIPLRRNCWSATLHGGGQPAQSEIDIEIDTSSIHTRDEKRDAHLRSPDFLDTERHPLLTFRSTKVEKAGVDALRVQGDLTIHGVTRIVELDVDSTSPATKDPWGNVRMAASASTVISRKDFGLTWNAALETGGVLVGDEVTIDLDVQFVKSQAWGYLSRSTLIKGDKTGWTRLLQKTEPRSTTKIGDRDRS